MQLALGYLLSHPCYLLHTVEIAFIIGLPLP